MEAASLRPLGAGDVAALRRAARHWKQALTSAAAETTFCESKLRWFEQQEARVTAELATCVADGTPAQATGEETVGSKRERATDELQREPPDQPSATTTEPALRPRQRVARSSPMFSMMAGILANNATDTRAQVLGAQRREAERRARRGNLQADLEDFVKQRTEFEAKLAAARDVHANAATVSANVCRLADTAVELEDRFAAAHWLVVTDGEIEIPFAPAVHTEHSQHLAADQLARVIESGYRTFRHEVAALLRAADRTGAAPP